LKFLSVPWRKKTGRSSRFRGGAIFAAVISSGDPRREEFMRAQLAEAGLDHAVWLNNPNKPNVPLELISALKNSDVEMTEGEFSCTLKHYLALQMFLQSGLELALVMEDGIEFRGQFAQRLADYRRLLPRSFDMMFDGDLMRIPKKGRAYSNIGSADFSLVKMKRGVSDWSHGATNGANCYLLTRRAARRITRSFLPFGNVIDHHLNDIIRRERLNVYWPLPPAVHKRRIASTVQFEEDGTSSAMV
jgi:GR25 family glycosyltransferase involved in LPS biosynthesis